MVNKEKAAAKTRVRLETDERRQKLLALGRELFGKHSYDELSISDIAELAGISKGLLYHYFPTKREFYVETVREAAAEILRLTEADESLSPHDRMLHSLEAYLGYVEENAAAYVSLMKSGVGVDPDVAELVENVRRTFADRVTEQLGIKKVSPVQRLALTGWVGLVEAVSIDWVKTKGVSRTELARFLSRQFELMMMSVALLPTVKAAIKGFFK